RSWPPASLVPLPSTQPTPAASRSARWPGSARHWSRHCPGSGWSGSRICGSTCRCATRTGRGSPRSRTCAPASGQVEGVVEAVERGFRYRPQLKVAIGDDSRQTLLLRFFHFNRAQAEQLQPGTRLLCYGEVRHAAQGLEMVHPNYQRLSGNVAASVDELLTPVYPTTEGLGPKRLAAVIGKALERLPADAQLELIPPELCAANGLASLRDAL